MTNRNLSERPHHANTNVNINASGGNGGGNTVANGLGGGGSDIGWRHNGGHQYTSSGRDSALIRTQVQNIFNRVNEICAEKNVSDMISIITDEQNQKQYNIYYTADKVTTTPHLMIKWNEGKFGKIVKIYMNQHVKPFRKQIRIDKPETYDAIINTAIDTLVAQNETHNETKAMIENCVSQFNLDIEPEYIRRTKTLWHVSYKKDNLPHSIVIQYDERTKEFLFQKRYITNDDVVDLVNTTSRTI